MSTGWRNSWKNRDKPSILSSQKRKSVEKLCKCGFMRVDEGYPPSTLPTLRVGWGAKVCTCTSWGAVQVLKFRTAGRCKARSNPGDLYLDKKSTPYRSNVYSRKNHVLTDWFEMVRSEGTLKARESIKLAWKPRTESCDSGRLRWLFETMWKKVRLIMALSPEHRR